MEKLSVGAQAPDFETVAFDGRPVHLKDYQGKKVWLSFYRYFNCPLCMDHLFDVSARYEKLQAANIEVLAVFESERLKFGDKAKAAKFPTFPLIPDPRKNLYQLYGTENRVSGLAHPKVALKFFQALARGFKQGPVEGDMGQIPAHFLLHENGQIYEAFYGNHIADQIPWEDIEKFIKEPRREPPKKKIATV